MSTLTALRDATAPLHQALDRSLTFARSERREPLVAYLRAMLGFLGPAEAHLWGLPELADLEPERRQQKAEWLRADLRRLGETPSSDRWAGSFPTGPAALGRAYVLEGSTLGGRVLARKPHLAGLRVFEGYGDHTGRLWRALVERLEESASHRSAIVAEARATFVALHAWLEARGAATPAECAPSRHP